MFASFTLGFALQLRKKHEKTLVVVRKTCQSTVYILPKKNTHTYITKQYKTTTVQINPLNTKLNPICHLLALLGVHHILHISRVRVKTQYKIYPNEIVTI
jgi:hypothetical protein